ncbi:two-component system chemotaxis sensor kinase CheA [Ruminiclostridium sufflavum DSM 19573]|uniref:Chemotaxis protein CheA n=1 Tax=Ruminiclostridium sufflavum DSM 19573 TaxID=1121337 RepID=A0A318XL49_9FIRM|nr:chemotaxis protein CheA [Ruminiclostridium sufflavum]PYG88253.1 two-component system chemotaxis sensor kinase CheA [Ruminiclostridium sufflavum DSM 19573]
MDNGFSNQTILDTFIYETAQNIEQLEEIILTSEKASCFAPDAVNEIFRIMHTIKGSSAMMRYSNIASISHATEDLFYYIREERPENMDCSLLSDLILECVDFIKLELEKVKNEDILDGEPSNLIEKIRSFLISIKKERNCSVISEMKEQTLHKGQYTLSRKDTETGELKAYEAVIYFEEGCEMENIRAYTIIYNLKKISEDCFCFPEDITEDNGSVNIIQKQGFKIIFKCGKSMREMYDFLNSFAFIRDLELTEASGCQFPGQICMSEGKAPEEAFVKMSGLQASDHAVHGSESKGSHQSIISVDVQKLDKLMDLMGEMVISEAMVTQNPELEGMSLSSFYKAARQLRKITSEMQDMVMSIRMVPLSATFHKMQRIVRDMGRSLDKEVELMLIGEETEVDKNIIEHISDPLMHLVRNAVDHGIESYESRISNGKSKAGKVALEAKNAGSDVLVIVKDDGKGLNKEKILQKAKEHGLLSKPENEMTDREIFNLIFLPGFSTNDKVTEFSGRGVGMDVVVKNLEAVGGSVSIESEEGAGTVTTMKIPLTLAIIDGMNIRVGNAKYTLPTTSIQETFQPKSRNIVEAPGRNEMIMVRGECYPILRLHKMYSVKTDITDFEKGIMLMVEQDGKCMCLFADELLGQQQVVVKALPSYIKDTRNIKGLAGCTLLGDGSISLILNIGGLLNIKI